MSRKKEHYTLEEIATMSREETNALWLAVIKELEEKDPKELTDNEKNYLTLAYFYTQQQ